MPDSPGLFNAKNIHSSELFVCQSKVVMSYSCKVEMSYRVRCMDDKTSRKGGNTPDEQARVGP